MLIESLFRTSGPQQWIMGMLKKAASGVLNVLPSSRTGPYAPGVKPSAALLDELF